MSCGGKSFTPDTRVLLAFGAAAAISSLKPGDKVTATNVTTGKTQPETVTAVEVHHDTDLYDLNVKTGHGTEVIHTTASHLIYDPYLHQGWIPAKQLKPGMHLKTPDGQAAVVVGGSVPADHDGWMWDLTVPGNNDHDFYVLATSDGQNTMGGAGGTSVLVHNDDPTDPLTFFGDYTGRLDQFTVRGGQASFEIHVYYQGTEYGIYGPAGWFPKHGLGVPTDAPPQLESVLKGYAVDWMRRARILKPGQSIKGNDWMRPGLTQGLPEAGC